MAFARGKVILLGEHSVVYGRPALAAALGIGVTAVATEASEDVLHVSPWNVSIRPSPDADEPLARAFHAVLETYGARPRLEVRAECALPAGAGLGCSAAVGVAVLGALDEALHRARSPQDRGDAALVWEEVFHGNPSGVDNAMASCGGVAVYTRGKPLAPVHVQRPLPLVVCHSGEPSLTKTTVAQVARFHERDPKRADEIFDAIASIVINGRNAVETGDLAKLGQLFDMNQMLLSTLLLSTDRLETLVKAARDAGALGAKLTGGGGGGCMIALAEDRASAEQVASALRAQGGEPFVVEAGT
jgi:mevalonate kinase